MLLQLTLEYVRSRAKLHGAHIWALSIIFIFLTLKKSLRRLLQLVTIFFFLASIILSSLLYFFYLFSHLVPLSQSAQRPSCAHAQLIVGIISSRSPVVSI